MDDNLALMGQYLTEDDWNFDTQVRNDEPFITLGVTGESGKWTLYLFAAPDGVVVASSVLDVFVPEPRRPETALLLTFINYRLRMGAFTLDLSDGEVSFRIGIDVEGGHLAPTMFRNMQQTNLATMDHWFPTIMSVAYGNVAAAVAYEQRLAEIRTGL